MPTAAETVMRRWFLELWNEKKPQLAKELAHADVVIHDANTGVAPQVGLDGFLAGAEALQSAFPDIHFTVDDVVESGDKIATRVTVTGTHTGPGLGIEPTGKRFTINGLAIGRFADGKLVEGWNGFDLLSMYEQLGAVKRPG